MTVVLKIYQQGPYGRPDTRYSCCEAMKVVNEFPGIYWTDFTVEVPRKKLKAVMGCVTRHRGMQEDLRRKIDGILNK